MVAHRMTRSALRLLYRVPLWLHGAGIAGYERLLGIDWLVLTTRGRRSGRPRQVVLDVIAHEEDGDVWYVQPADEVRAQWFLNVRAHPSVRVEVRGRRFEARATVLTGPAAARIVRRFLREHPWYARVVVWLVGYVDRIDLPDAELLARLEGVTVVALRPTPG